MSRRYFFYLTLLWSCIALFLNGCGQATNGAPGEDNSDSAATKPATLTEVRKAVDWLTFPKPDNAVWEETSMINTNYWVPGTLDNAVVYYRKTMGEQGWRELPKTNPEAQPNKYRSLSFTKDEFLVEAFLEGGRQSVKVNLRNCGNTSARRLPKPADAKVTGEGRVAAVFTTELKPADVAAFCQKEFPALGWRSTPVLGAANYAKAGMSKVRFVQNAMQCEATSQINKEGQTEVIYHAAIRDTFEPAMVFANLPAKELAKPATTDEMLNMLDTRKLPRLGELDANVNTGLRIEYETKSGVDQAVVFYRNTLGDLGWKLTLPMIDLLDRGELRFEKEGHFVLVEIRPREDAGFVVISLTNHGNVDSRQLPYPPGTEIELTPHMNSLYTGNKFTALTPELGTNAEESIAAFYREELSKLGWKETERKELIFHQNGGFVRFYVGTTVAGQTPVNVSVGRVED